ncbi:intercellular adhesion molecule 4 isoform X1 [Lemur catta]|uniref:intercellular adhesion molecule 4 isoform X1 n=1 Tax=Lemur catta TaxID=9447 RepID=UPI001E267414|nr:intercellular adhesion molecule 4 isoform X1 [Lemur catta]
MGSVFPLSLLLLLAASYWRSGTILGRRVRRAQGPRESPPAPSGTSASFWVRINPQSVAVRPGASVWLNCSNSCPLPPNSSLHTQLRRGKTFSGPGWVSYQLLDVRAWSSDVRCFVTCAEETRGATARITTYKAPHSVILEPPVLEGGMYTLRCHVTRVFPVGFLVVTLRRGSRVIYSESLERFTGLDPANVTLTHAFHAGFRDLGQPVTCLARLNLDGLVVGSSSAPITLTLAWSPASKALAFTSIAVLVIILVAVGAAYLRRCLAMRSLA